MQRLVPQRLDRFCAQRPTRSPAAGGGPLAAALAAVIWRRRGIPFKATSTDWLALVYAGFVVLYALIPQGWLGGDASAEGILYALRHNLTPVACYFLGRGLTLTTRDRRVVGALILGAIVLDRVLAVRQARKLAESRDHS